MNVRELFRGQRVTDANEGMLVDLLLTEKLQRLFVLSALRLPGHPWLKTKVPRAAVTESLGKPGDIDVLACEPGHPERAVAIECEVLKVRARHFEDDVVSKLGHLRDGTLQANGLGALGFHRAYLMVAVAVDGSERTLENFFGRGLTAKQAGTIQRALQALVLDDRVGLLRLETVQTIDRSITETGGVGCWEAKPPVLQEQPKELTERIRRYFTSS